MEVSPPRGRLTAVYGCMFAGKTSRLIALLEQAAASGRRVAAFKHALDARYHATRLVTHDGRGFEAQPIAAAHELLDRSAGAQTVGVDEAQFFGPALTPVCEALLAAGVDVVVAGINFNAWGEPFPPLDRLVAIADERDERLAPCARCGRSAMYSQRVTPIVGGDMVGGLADYEPRCRACFVPLPGSPR